MPSGIEGPEGWRTRVVFIHKPCEVNGSACSLRLETLHSQTSPLREVKYDSDAKLMCNNSHALNADLSKLGWLGTPGSETAGSAGFLAPTRSF